MNFARDERRELEEAIRAGERALQALRKAEDRLGKARGWGIFDLVSAGVISSFIKHRMVDQAAECVNEAEICLRSFSQKIKDVRDGDLLRFDGLTRFVDIFVDSIFVDLLVQRRIKELIQRMRSASASVQSLLDRLYQLEHQLEREAGSV